MTPHTPYETFGPLSPRTQWPALVTPELTHIIADSNYTMLYYSDNRKVCSARTLGWWHKRLPGFLRIRRGTIINPAHVRWWKWEHMQVAVGGHVHRIDKARVEQVRHARSAMAVHREKTLAP